MYVTMYIESILKNGILLAQVLFNNGRSMYGVDSVEWRWMVIVSFLLFGILSFTGIENSPCEPALYQKKNSQVHFIKKIEYQCRRASQSVGRSSSHLSTCGSASVSKFHLYSRPLTFIFFTCRPPMLRPDSESLVSVSDSPAWWP